MVVVVFWGVKSYVGSNVVEEHTAFFFRHEVVPKFRRNTVYLIPHTYFLRNVGIDPQIHRGHTLNKHHRSVHHSENLTSH